MANEITNTEMAAAIPEHWVPEVVAALYDNNSLFTRVENKSQNVKENGDTVTFAVAPALTPQTVGSDGAVTVATPTLTEVDLSLNTHEAILVEMLKSTKKQSFKNWWNQLPQQAGAALLESMESDILGLGSGFTSNTAVGDGLGHADEDMLTAMVGTLVRSKLPVLRKPGEFTFVFDGKEYEYIRRLKVLDYDRTGVPGKGGAADPDVPRLYGIPFFFSNQVQSSSSQNQNLLFHKTAIGAGIQEDISLEMGSGLANRKLTRLLSVDALWGVIELVDARAVRGLTTDA